MKNESLTSEVLFLRGIAIAPAPQTNKLCLLLGQCASDTTQSSCSIKTNEEEDECQETDAACGDNSSIKARSRGGMGELRLILH